MKRPLDIVLLVDEAYVSDDDPLFESATGELSAEHHVARALRDEGHAVRIVAAGTDVAQVVQPLTGQPPDLVFNLTEQFRDDRALDKSITGLLELMDLPFTGSGSTGLVLCRDKALCKRILCACGADVPQFIVIPPRRRPSLPESLAFPLVVKPLLEDGSDGICNASLVRNEDELMERARMIHARFSQPAIAEEYIEGRELYVSVVGNRKLTVFPVRELHLNGNGGPRLATYRAKWDRRYQRKWGIETDFADLPPAVLDVVERVCKHAFHALQIQDYGRIDLRLTPQGRVVVLEANPNPNLARDDEVAQSADRAGVAYRRLIDTIVRLALHRHGHDA